MAARFDAYGWHTRSVPDGNDTEDVAKAIKEAQVEQRRPSLILARTHIGYGSPHKQDNFSAHGGPLGEEELQATKKALGWPTMDNFYLPSDAGRLFPPSRPAREEAGGEMGQKLDAYRKDFPKEAAEFEQIASGTLPKDWAADLPHWSPTDKPIATRRPEELPSTRSLSVFPTSVGGSADLNPSTRTALKGLGDFQPSESGGAGTLGAVGGEWSYAGQNIAFGVREHAMGAIVNGMAAHGGVLPFSATFFKFSDYMKPAIRSGL